MKDVLVIAKALSEASRVRVLLCLQDGVLCAGQIAEVLDLAPSTVSKHMGILVKAELVETWSEGRWRYYRLANGAMAPMARQVLEAVCQSLAESADIQADQLRARTIRMRADAPVPGRIESNTESRLTVSTGCSMWQTTSSRRPAETSERAYSPSMESQEES